MKRLTKLLALTMVLLMATTSCSKPGASDDPAKNPDQPTGQTTGIVEPIKLKFSDINSPVSNNATFTNHFAELVAEKTEGRVEVEVYMGGTLSGYDIEACRNGIADMVQMVPSMGDALDPRLSILDAPFVYRDLEHLLKVIDPRSPVIAAINEELQAQGVRLLGAYNLGRRQMTTNDPVYSPADLKGMKIRVVPSVIYNKLFEELGATPTPMAYSEVATSLLTNVIDGQENPYPTIYNDKFYEVQNYVIETNHLWTLAGVFINEKSFQKLSETDRELVYDAFAEASEAISRDVEEQAVEAKANIEKAGKAQIITAEDGLDLDAFHQVGVAVSEDFKDDWGDLYEVLVGLGE